LRLTPTSNTIAPGFTIAPRTIPATPAAATMTSAWAHQLVEINGLGVGEGDCGIEAPSPEQESNRSTHCHSAAKHHHMLSLPGKTMALHEFHDSLGCARKRGFHHATDLIHQAPQVHRVKAICILDRIDALEDHVLVNVVRQWQLDDVSGHPGIVIELIDSRQYLLLSSAGWQVNSIGLNPDFGTILVFARDIPLGTGVVADQNCSQSWRESHFPQNTRTWSAISTLSACAVAIPSSVVAGMETF
jgi:hypothetical protein